MTCSCVVQFRGARQYSSPPGYDALRRRARWLKVLGDESQATHWPGLPSPVRSRVLGSRDYLLWHGEGENQTYSALHSLRAGMEGPATVLHLLASSQAEAWLEAENGIWALALTGSQDPESKVADREWIIRLEGSEELALTCERAIRVRMR